jgi:hypothetical protein
MERVCSSETLVNSYQTARRLILEDSTAHSHSYENLKTILCEIFIDFGNKWREVTHPCVPNYNRHTCCVTHS